jgi:hypothetical protein
LTLNEVLDCKFASRLGSLLSGPEYSSRRAEKRGEKSAQLNYSLIGGFFHIVSHMKAKLLHSSKHINAHFSSQASESKEGETILMAFVSLN